MNEVYGKDGNIYYTSVRSNEEMKIRRYQSAVTKNTRKASERIIKLEHNWNELKSWLEEEIKTYDDVGLKFKKQGNFECASRSYNYLKQYQVMLSKMQSLEEGGNNE